MNTGVVVPAADRPAHPWWRQVVVALAVCSGVGLLMGAHFALDLPSRGVPLAKLRLPLAARLVEELTAAWGSGLLFFTVRAMARRFRLDRPGRWRALPAHLVALPVLATVHTFWMWGSRTLAFPVVGLGAYNYGEMPWRFFMELPIQVVLYVMATIGVYVTDRARDARKRELRNAALESRISQARLENLELRLRPHFLFNALNTISSTMYTDPQAADEMIDHLAVLLRRSLQKQDSHEVPLAEELGFLEHYVSLVRARFGEDVSVTTDVDPTTLDLLVPALILQPLVENAVRHGRTSADGHGRIEISTRREGAKLHLAVRDDGPGEGSGGGGSGLGLSVTAERLELLYGDQHVFRAGADEHGFLVALTLPARAAGKGGEP